MIICYCFQAIVSLQHRVCHVWIQPDFSVQTPTAHLLRQCVIEFLTRSTHLHLLFLGQNNAVTTVHMLEIVLARGQSSLARARINRYTLDTPQLKGDCYLPRAGWTESSDR